MEKFIKTNMGTSVTTSDTCFQKICIVEKT